MIAPGREKSARRLPDVFYNPVSIAGGAVALACFATIVFLTIVGLFQSKPPAYIGIISYVALPVPLLLSLATVFLGVWRERRLRRKGKSASRMVFTIDLNIPQQRSTVAYFSMSAILFFLFTAYGSYRAFEWTESVQFCGQTCHTVMEPEYTSYQYSPHARVRCVDCHVGGGAGWYVRSKLSGAYQVYAVLANNFPRPIPVPITNLRPAQETCEQCHWPAFFAGEKEELKTYFKSEEGNGRWTVDLMMKTGGGAPGGHGPARGIHWHMNIADQITYVTTDSLDQTIPWLQARNRTTGAVTEYISSDADRPVEELKKLPVHTLDCIGCHNQPSHRYRPPVRIVDESMALGRISTDLPDVRSAAIQALVAPYSSTRAAMDSIPVLMESYYRQAYPAVAHEKGYLITAASAELREQYRRNFFPEMRVSWQAYPDNVGHLTSPGCFRCHDGKHRSADGRVISRKCNTCHTIMYQGPAIEPATLNAEGIPFRHPVDIGDTWKETDCSECHTGQ
jgi:hypothetical protein